MSQDEDAREFLQDYLPYLLNRADQLLSQGFHQELLESGIHMSEWRIMAVLFQHKVLSMSALIDLTMQPQPTVTHSVTRLEKRGHVERVPGEQDRRQRIVSLTRAGRKEATRLTGLAEVTQAQVMNEIEIDVDDLRKVLGDLVLELESMDPATIEASTSRSSRTRRAK